MRTSAARRRVFQFDAISIVYVPAGVGPRAGRVSVRYRDVTGEFVDTTLDRVSVNDVAASRPVREFCSYKGRLHYSGWYWAATVKNLLAYESRLELARIMLADFDRDVTGIATQPFQLVGRDRGELRRHVPDVLVRAVDGSVTVVDVKPAHRLSDPKVAAVFAWTREVAACRGWAFEVWSGADAHLLANVRFLAGYRRPLVIDGGLVPAVLAVAADQPTIGGIECAMARVAPSRTVRPVLLHLVWSGALTADLSGPLGADTSVRVTRRGPA
jgi:hypothetical protein